MSKLGIGFGLTMQRGRGLAVASVAITGLTGNTAQDGVALGYTTSNLDGLTVASVSWKVGGVQDGIAATYTPNASTDDLGALTLEVTLSDASVLSAGPFTIRYAPPTAAGAIADQSWPEDTAITSLNVATDFTGGGITYALAPSSAALPAGLTLSSAGAITGTPTTPNTSRNIVIRGSNSGGSTDSAFSVTVTGVVASTFEFGALTAVGAGATTSAAADGDYGQLTVWGGVISPNTSPLTAGTQAVGAETWTIVANKATVASAEEFRAAFDALPAATATGILIRAGDYSAEAPKTIAAKAFTNLVTVEPAAGFSEAATPPENTWGVTLPGLIFTTGTSNVTFKGVSFYDTLNDLGAESLGVIQLASGADIAFEACEVHSRDFNAAFDAGVFGDSPGFTAYASQTAFFSALNATRGIVNGGVDNIKIERCYLHDLTRGIVVNNLRRTSTNRGKIVGNYIIDCVTNGTTVGGRCEHLDILDNRIFHMWGSDLEVPSNPLHGSVGLSFDPPSTVGELMDDIVVMGNIAHVGWHKYKRVIDGGGTYTGDNSSTGMKVNDPNTNATNAFSYANFKAAFNVIVTGGIGMEFTGTNGVDAFNNTIAQDTVSAVGSYPYIYLQGAQNARVWNNIGAKMTLGGNDGALDFVASLDTMDGYGNLIVTAEDYFIVNSMTGYPYITLAQLETAFTPDAGSYALTAEQKKGAIGTGLYSGNGVHTATFNKPTPAAGTAQTYDTTVWDGSTNYGVIGTSSRLGDAVTQFTVMFQVEFTEDGTTEYFWGNQFRKFEIYRNSANKLVVYGKDSASNIRLNSTSDFTLTAADGKVSVAVSVDMTTGRVQMVKNGVQDKWNGEYQANVGTSLDFNEFTHVFAQWSATNPFKGKMDFFWLTDEFVDLDNQTKIEALYTAAGAFESFGADGSTVTGTQPRYFYNGDAAGFSNKGSLGTISVQGTLADDGADVTAPVITGSATPSIVEGNTAVGTYTANETVTWSLTGVDAALFSITGGNLAFLSAPDFSAPGDSGANNVYDVNVVATDTASNVSTLAVAVTVTEAAAGFAPTTVSVLNPTVTATADVATPTNLAGDIIVKWQFGVQADSAHTTNVPAGYEMIGERTGGAENRKILIAAKISTGGETGNHTLVSAGPDEYGGGSFVLRLDSAPTSISAAVAASIGVSTTGSSPAAVATGATTGVVIPLAIYHVVGQTVAITTRNFTGMTSTFDTQIFDTAYQEAYAKGLLLQNGDARADYSASLPNDQGTYNTVLTLAIGLS